MTRMIGRFTVFGLGALALVAGLLGVFLITSRGNPIEAALGSGLVLGPPVLEVRSPQPEERYAPGGVPVLVAFRAADRVARGTLRCLLNGRDVTHQLTTGANGAAGNVFPVREGENSLRVEVYARGLWTDRYFEDSVELRFRVRGARSLDRT